jgi:hypothetical protein
VSSQGEYIGTIYQKEVTLLPPFAKGEGNSSPHGSSTFVWGIVPIIMRPYNQRKGPMLCTGPFPKIVTGVHYEILFSYPSVESYSGDKLHGQLVAKQPVEPFSRSPFSSGFHAPGGCELGLRLDLQKTPVTNSKVPYQLYEPTALLQAYPWKTFQALSLLQESHTTSEPGNHSVSIDRFL